MTRTHPRSLIMLQYPIQYQLIVPSIYKTCQAELLLETKASTLCPKDHSTNLRECSPWLVSMEWYPFLFLELFLQLVFPCRHTCSLQRHMAPSLHHFLFLWKMFLLPLFNIILGRIYYSYHAHGHKAAKLIYHTYKVLKIS